MNVLSLNDTKISSTFEVKEKVINTIISLGLSHAKTCVVIITPYELQFFASKEI